MNASNTDSYYKEQAEKAKKYQDGMILATQKTNLPYRIICTDALNWDEYAQIIVYGDKNNTG